MINNNHDNPRINQQISTNKYGCLSIIVFLVTLLWIVTISFSRHITILIATIDPSPAIRIPILMSTLTQMLLIGIPLIPLAFLWPTPRFKMIFQSWLLAWISIIIFSPAIILDPSAAQACTLIHIILAILLSVVIMILSKMLFSSRNKLDDHAYTQYTKQEIVFQPKFFYPLAILLSTTSSIPWLIFGAFGSILDTILQIIFSLFFGLAASLIINHFLKSLYLIHSEIPKKDFFLNGLSIGTILLLLSSAITYGFSGIQLFLMLILPLLGWIISSFGIMDFISVKNYQYNESFGKTIKRAFPLGFFIGLVTTAPLCMLDPDELVLVLNATSGEVLSGAAKATLFSLAILFGFSIFLLIILIYNHFRSSEKPINQNRYSLVIVFTAAASMGLCTFAYFTNGQPGFYGENLFIILNKQADLTSIPDFLNYSDRRDYVYDTLILHANTSQDSLRKELDRFGIPYTPYYLVNALEVPNNPIIRLWMSLHPDVDRILPSPRLRPLPKDLPISNGMYDSITGTEWNLSMIDADRVWKEFGVTGEGIIIGQSDSGAQADHPELARSYRGRTEGNDYNWFDPWNHSLSPIDFGGHGTHTLGTMVGENVGVAPGAKWYACVNLARNLANPPLYLDCMQFMLSPFPLNGDPFTQGDPSKGANIINNSWGCPEIEGCDALVFQPAVSALRIAGIFIVVSAGNDGPKCETLIYPLSLYDEVFSVGAINRSGNLASFSSIGPVTSDGSNRIKPDIVAPGVSIMSSTPGNTYDSYGGTSMAGPHVAGVVALIWSANPSLIGNIDLTEEILIKSASPYEGDLPVCPGVSGIPSTAYGFGIVNAYDAVKTALEYDK